MGERISLLGGTYEARSIIADAQKCINLYPESNPKDAESPTTHYPTPGLQRQLLPPSPGAARGAYTATNGFLYYIVGRQVIFIDSNFVQTVLGNLSANLTTPVGIIDNGNVVVIVDGTPDGYAIDLATNTFAQINDPAFLGATNVDYVDTFLVFNQPNTRNFYASLSNVTFADLTQAGAITGGVIANAGTGYTPGTYPAQALTGGSGTGATADITVSGGGAITDVVIVDPGVDYEVGDQLSAAIPAGSNFRWDVAIIQQAFDPLWIAAKTGFPDEISTLTVVHREIWLMGIVKTSEVWYDAGGAQFPFQILPGVFVEHGCQAKFSLAKHDLVVFWLGIDANGKGTVYKGEKYSAIPISTYAISEEISKYAVISDAIGMTYKQADHVFYMLSFPSANKTWVYDYSENLWHQRAWTNPNDGSFNRHRANCFALAYGKTLCGDWENGALYEMNEDYTTDFEGPIVRVRSLPHLTKGLNRMSYSRFMADMECGNGITDDPETTPEVTLRYSNDRGRTYIAAPMQSMGLQGQYYVIPTWHQLGMARDRVFELSWSSATITALNGAYVDVMEQTPPGT